MSWAIIAVTGAAMVFSRLPGDRAGFRRSFAAADLTKVMRMGSQLALVGPITVRSHAFCNRAVSTSRSCQPLWVRALLKRMSSASEPSMPISVEVTVEQDVLKLGCYGLYTSAVTKLWKNNWFAGRFTKT